MEGGGNQKIIMDYKGEGERSRGPKKDYVIFKKGAQRVSEVGGGSVNFRPIPRVKIWIL